MNCEPIKLDTPTNVAMTGKFVNEGEATPVKVNVSSPRCADGPFSIPPGMNAPPGLNMTPPGLGKDDVSLQRQIELAKEAHRLQEDRQRLMNERLELETTRLAHENALLRARLQFQAIPSPVSSSQGPPGVWTPSFNQNSWGQQPAQPQRSKLSSRKSEESQDSTIAGSDSEDAIPAVADESEASCGEALAETTIMMRNIPNSYTREKLLLLLDGHGFACHYDLVYLPIDFTSRSGLGYAFINFTTPQDAKRFRDIFHGFDDWGVFSEKACDAHGSATHQGLDANIERYRNSPMMHESVPDEFRPVTFKDGVRVPFPPPTRRLRAPDLRRRNLSSEMGSGSD